MTWVGAIHVRNKVKRMSIRRSGWICLIALSLCGGFAQQNGPAGGPKPAAAPAGGADRRITLDVVVNDKAGKPVTGLEQGDLSLFDDKQPLSIVSFRSVEGGVAKNNPPAEVVLLLDEMNAPFAKVTEAREQIKKFLQKYNGELPVPISMGYFSYEGIKMLDSPTRDGNALLASIERGKNALRAPPPGQGAYGAFDRRQAALQGLGQVVNTVSARPGRKLVIWISPGWPLLIGPHVELSAKDRQWIFDAVVALSSGLRQAGISLYQVDPLGPADVSGGTESYSIAGAAQSSYSIAGGAQTSYALGYVKGVRSPKQVANADLSLQVLAVQSGGQILNANNDIAGELAMCVADATAYYSVSFDGPAASGPNDYHALEVKLAKPGLTARTRTGYYSRPAR